MSDVPSLVFVDPAESARLFRTVLWGAPGAGKSVGAASAPDPIAILSADRPGAYRYARRKYPAKDLRETRYENSRTLDMFVEYVRQSPDLRTVVIDPVHNIVERLVDQAPLTKEQEPNYQAANKRFLKFIYDLRAANVHVVMVAHERLNDGKKGDNKMYPQLGGPSLINKVLAECDIVAHVERERGPEGGPDTFWGQLTSYEIYVCKEATGMDLGDRLQLDLTAWFDAATPSTDDLPFVETEAELVDQVKEAFDATEETPQTLDVGPS